MPFLAPWALVVALGALPLILMLHLIQERRQRVRIPSLQLWLGLEAMVQHRRRRLPITLPLLLRLLVAALLALALGRPLLSSGASLPNTDVIIIDTSLSMTASDVVPSRFVAAQQEAHRIIAGAGAQDDLALVTLSDPPRLVARGSAAAHGDIETALSQLTPHGHDGSLDDALALAQVSGDTHHLLRLFVLSDTSYRGSAVAEVKAPVEWRRFGSSNENSGLAAFGARTTIRGTQLYARVANYGQRPVSRTITVALDGKPVLTEQVRLDGGGEAEWSWPLPAGVETASATLTPADAFALDDQQTIVLRGTTTVHVLLVSTGASPLERALQALPNVVVTSAKPAAYTAAGSDVVVFQGFVPAELPPVPTWIVAPPASPLLPVVGTRGELVATGVRDERFSAIDLRPVHFGNVAVLRPPDWASVAVAAGDVPLILTGSKGGQPVAIWSFDPGKLGLDHRLQFPLLAATTMRELVGEHGQSAAPGDLAPRALIDPAGRPVAAGTPLKLPGLYRDSQMTAALAVNLIDSQEPDLAEHPAPQINRGAIGSVPTIEQRREAWQPLIAVLCAMLLLESALAAWRGGRRSAPVTT
ncbi:MAG: VWA domain-containing protein [Herpetosiphon sp.]